VSVLLCMVLSSTVTQWYSHNLLARQHSSHKKKSVNTYHRLSGQSMYLGGWGVIYTYSYSFL